MENIKWISTTGDAVTLLTALVFVVVAASMAVVFMYRYRSFMARRRFNDELKQFALDDREQATLAELVLKHSSDEPVKVLYSLPVFDSIAKREIEHVLASSASREAKEEFIANLYSIRLKTFFASDEQSAVAA